MPLELAPSYDDHTREQIENHLSAVRARRMVAAIEYQQGVQEDLRHESDKIQVKMAKQYAYLLKDLEKLEIAELKVQDRLTTLEALRQELGLTTDMMGVLATPATEREE